MTTTTTTTTIPTNLEPQQVDWATFQREMARCSNPLSEDTAAFLDGIRHLEKWYCALMLIHDGTGSGVVVFSHLARNGLWLISPVQTRGYDGQPSLFHMEPFASAEPFSGFVGKILICFGGEHDARAISAAAMTVWREQADDAMRLNRAIRGEWLAITRSASDPDSAAVHKAGREFCIAMCVRHVDAEDCRLK
jgi:hypothetical protein